MNLAFHLALLSWQTPLVKWHEYSTVLRFAESSGCVHLDFHDERWRRELVHLVSQVGCLSQLQDFLVHEKWHAIHVQWRNRLAEMGAHFIYPGHADYPRAFYQLEEPPLALSFLGSPCWVERKCLAVVGSREPCYESLLWLEQELGRVLKVKDWVVVSGGARGIDQKSHAVSLRHRRPTVVSIPSGLGRLYPRNLSEWVAPVLESGGAILSCFPPEREMYKSQFRRRNQLIAQMGQALLIVEAGRPSGTLMTANLALEREQTIGVIPGHPMEPRFFGSLDLLRLPVKLIREGHDLLELLGEPVQDLP